MKRPKESFKKSPQAISLPTANYKSPTCYHSEKFHLAEEGGTSERLPSMSFAPWRVVIPPAYRRAGMAYNPFDRLKISKIKLA